MVNTFDIRWVTIKEKQILKEYQEIKESIGKAGKEGNEFNKDTHVSSVEAIAVHSGHLCG